MSLAAERFEAEAERGLPYPQARTIAMRAALIPIVNSLFATGLVCIGTCARDRENQDGHSNRKPLHWFFLLTKIYFLKIFAISFQ